MDAVEHIWTMLMWLNNRLISEARRVVDEDWAELAARIVVCETMRRAWVGAASPHGPYQEALVRLSEILETPPQHRRVSDHHWEVQEAEVPSEEDLVCLCQAYGQAFLTSKLGNVSSQTMFAVYGYSMANGIPSKSESSGFSTLLSAEHTFEPIRRAVSVCLAHKCDGTGVCAIAESMIRYETQKSVAWRERAILVRG